ncbi:MAG: hypothetical protein HZB26_16785 [Candidatus Hydrogenedentes bacterium]|nr:hypothetical protein [Candidatus Hydrogenedentota bacterium]
MKRVALVFALAVTPLLFLTGCGDKFPVSIPGITGSGESDEQQIAAVLDDVQRGMQARRIFKVLAHVSHSYHDKDGRDYAAVERYLNLIFERYRTIKINRVPPRITVQGERALAVETYGTLAEPVNAAKDPPINLQGQISVYLQKVGGTWQITEWAN